MALKLHFVTSNVFLLILILCLIGLIVKLSTFRYRSSLDLSEDLIAIIKNQNETISFLESIVNGLHHSSVDLHGPGEPVVVERVVVKEIRVESENSNSLANEVLSTNFEMDCNSRYGIELVDAWRRSKEVWCDSSNSEFAAKVECFPFHQTHKKNDGRGPDMFCAAENIYIDFSKVKGSASSAAKPHLGDQYHSFDPGSIFSTCAKTEAYKSNLFMPHHSIQMNSFQDRREAPSRVETVEAPTYLLARDEDCENPFHSTADFMNMLFVLNVLEMTPQEMKVVLFDKHPDGPFIELIKTAFSPNHDILRASSYQGKTVLFKKLIFHLESPAALIFPRVARPDPLRCYSTSAFQAYRKFILKSFDLWDVPPPPIPTITLSLRHRTPQKNVGRIMANEDEVISTLRRGNLINLNVIDGGDISFREHLQTIRSTNILIGVHGAGLMMIMFAAEEAVLIEIHPSYRQDRHFRHAARMTGKIYMPVRSTTRETCQGSSDNVFIPIDQFAEAVNGAVRIARNFDDGISECGLECPYDILALDSKLDAHYKSTERKTSPINTMFPCG